MLKCFVLFLSSILCSIQAVICIGATGLAIGLFNMPFMVHALTLLGGTWAAMLFVEVAIAFWNLFKFEQRFV